MCYHLSLGKERDYLEERFQAKFTRPDSYELIYHASAFTAPSLPFIQDEKPNQIQFLKWGLIPHWVKDEESAEQIRFKTANARAETVFEKPSFRDSIRNRRGLVLADGFYEWRGVESRKYPYYIRFKDESAFAMAGIWDRWVNQKTGEVENTFSVITTDANSLIAKIHDKMRMPVILKQSDEEKWLSEDLEGRDIKEILIPYEEKDMEAYPVSKIISSRKVSSNVEEAIKPFEYPELKKL